MTNSNNGIRPSFWGSCAWEFLFSAIAGAYPVKIDPDNKQHIKTMRQFIAMLHSLEHTIPCVWCRHSFGTYLKELPIIEYTSTRRRMMRWLYVIHDKVNKKLIKQEYDQLKKAVAELSSKKLTKVQLRAKVAALRARICKTKPSPSFASVLAYYEAQRA